MADYVKLTKNLTAQIEVLKRENCALRKEIADLVKARPVASIEEAVDTDFRWWWQRRSNDG